MRDTINEQFMQIFVLSFVSFLSIDIFFHLFFFLSFSQIYMHCHWIIYSFTSTRHKYWDDWHRSRCIATVSKRKFFRFQYSVTVNGSSHNIENEINFDFGLLFLIFPIEEIGTHEELGFDKEIRKATNLMGIWFRVVALD